MNKYTLFDIIIGEDYTDSNGEKRTSWVRCGTIFRDAASGALSGRIMPQLSLSGSFIIKARQVRPSESGDGPALSKS